MMDRLPVAGRRVCAVMVLAVAALGLAGRCLAADRFDLAVAHPGRSADDLTRDARDHPAEILRLTAIGPGMRVADFLGGDGYFSELCSFLVGAQGQVLLINNAAYDKWSDGDRQARLANGRLPNVEHQTVDLDHMNLGAGTLDAIILSKVYHDLYWVDPTGEWPAINTAQVLDQLAHALKKGGMLLLIDHAAMAGHGSADASALHRIEESYARADFEKRGLHVIASSALLRRADDAHDKISYKPPMLGKTDRFVLVFRKG
jgi:predicted methyltransferase